MKIDVSQNQIQGDRKYQQDSLGQRDVGDAKLLILADGMGGYEGGEIASAIVVDTFMRFPDSSNGRAFLEEALALSNQKIETYKREHPHVSSMGTTLVALWISENTYQWISVGDSPLYCIQKNTIQRINQNHSVAGMLNLQVERGEILEKDAKENRNRHLLTSAILGDDISMVDLSPCYPLDANTLFILASDGIETLEEDEILKIVQASKGDIKSATKNLLQEVENKKIVNQDNATILMAFHKEEDKSERKRAEPSLIKMIFIVFIIVLSSLLLWDIDLKSKVCNLL